MTLIDTSVWIEFFRKDGTPAVRQAVAEHLYSATAAYTCPILYELVVGARPHEIDRIRETLRRCHRMQFTATCWEGAANLGQKLLRGGVTTTTGDVQIAFMSIESETPILCRDKHFDLIKRIVGDALDVRQMI